MIIKKKYKWFSYLYENDPSSKQIIDQAFDLMKVDESWKKELLKSNYNR